MKLATWNVNSLKVRLPQVLEFLADEGLQELRHTARSARQGTTVRPRTCWLKWIFDNLNRKEVFE